MDPIRSSQAPACFPEGTTSMESSTATSSVTPSSSATTSRTETGSGNQVEEYVCRYPASYAPPPQGAPSGPSYSAATLALMGGVPPTPTPSASFARADGTPFPTSTDGTPMYRQGDAEWGSRLMGAGEGAHTLKERGCAVSSMAMAISKLSGETLTPGALDEHLDTHGGYVGNLLVWGAAGSATEKDFAVSKTTAWSVDTVTKELEAGRPVVLGVDYKPGGSGGTLGTDHWVCLTRKEGNLFFANDPASGNEVRFKVEDGVLKQVPKSTESIQGYKSSGEFTTFQPLGAS
ncbi:C39 family peptidase [Pyxidicoccus parkwayensis]|uniref:C39 family peptidase n=1 Tax=Pyxidicoccus parkwayensis TaxID=2813578 RepID=A0ABX7NLJ9_9BACT|nr:C39 family peptidase [Pyxidicoccus parkwaysis]QSQ19296.1 C39 family peptidase [Pyxidicoccus parkwaysis]